jgi:hypothetical protein
MNRRVALYRGLFAGAVALLVAACVHTLTVECNTDPVTGIRTCHQTSDVSI